MFSYLKCRERSIHSTWLDVLFMGLFSCLQNGFRLIILGVKFYTIPPHFQAAACQESTLVNEVLRIHVWPAERLCLLTANAWHHYYYHFNNAAQALSCCAGNVKICHTDTSFPHAPSYGKWTVVTGQSHPSRCRWLQALELCQELCKHVLAGNNSNLPPNPL